jgi:predicted ribosomally synthesized peptide with nif11-like leader
MFTDVPRNIRAEYVTEVEMADLSAADLIRKMTTDPDFRRRVETAPTPEAKKALIEAAGFTDITPEDVRAAAAAQGTELSEAELEAVAGGRVVEWVGATAAVVGAAAAAGA